MFVQFCTDHWDVGDSRNCNAVCLLTFYESKDHAGHHVFFNLLQLQAAIS